MSRLPPPPSRQKGPGKPRMPPPTADNADDTPPPLPPSRPGAAPKHGGPPPSRSIPNGHGPAASLPEYLEPTDWTDEHKPPDMPSLPPRNFTPEEDVQQDLYDEAEIISAPPPRPVPQQTTVADEQETYEEVEEKAAPPPQLPPPPQEFIQETYEECEVKPSEPQAQEEEVYEETTEDNVYEMTDEPVQPTRPEAPPVPVSARPNRQIPLPPVSHPPSHKTTPSPRVEEAPDLPGRPSHASAPRKQSSSGDGRPGGLAISLQDLGQKKANLKKVGSQESTERNSFDKPDEEPVISPTDSIQDRIRKMNEKAAGKPSLAPKPALTPKPTPGVKATKAVPKHEQNTPQPVVSPGRPQKKEIVAPPSPIEDEIYDEASSFIPEPEPLDPLHNEEWFHGEIDRKECDSKLRTINQDGTFLIRKSAKGGEKQPYTLVVLYLGHVYNLKVRVRDDTQVALGDPKPDELAFKDVPTLISHHKAHDVILINAVQKKQYKTQLTRHPVAIPK